jgi:ribosome recycling factor
MSKHEQTAAPQSGTTTFKGVKEIEAHARTRMEKVLGDFQHEIGSIRTGRATISLLDSVRVDSYGTPSPLNQVAQLHVPDPTMLTVQPWDVSMIGPIEKAIRSADLGLNPSNDGKLIRVPVPPLTEERRRDLAKKCSHVAEEHRVALRNIRRDANEHLKKALKDKLISEDEEKHALDSVQKLTDSSIAKADQLGKAKEKEILELK